MVHLSKILFIVFLLFFIFSICNKSRILDFRNKKNNSKLKIYFFYVDWCIACKEFNIIWNKLIKKYSDKIIFKKIICNTKNKFCKKSKIKITGYPLIIIKKNKKKKYYTQQRDFITLDNFIQNIINSDIYYS
jgi:thiol-disulfide isomerase/thioredoxin